MKIHMFVSGLSMRERQRLANQTQFSVGYINQIARGFYTPSADFVQKVYHSQVNKGLIPAKMRFTKSDLEAHVEYIRKARTA